MSNSKSQRKETRRTREVCMAAETRLEHLLNEVVDKLISYNRRLLTLSDAISEMQGVHSGTICLELFPCGPGCLGCPHPRWMQYRWKDTDTKNGPLMGINLDAAKREPILALPRKSSNFEVLADLIREAKGITKDRSSLIAGVRTLRYAAKLSSSKIEEAEGLPAGRGPLRP